MQHTKTVAGYHGLNRDSDAIVIGGEGARTTASDSIPGAAVELQRTQPNGRQNVGLQ